MEAGSAAEDEEEHLGYSTRADQGWRIGLSRVRFPKDRKRLAIGDATARRL